MAQSAVSEVPYSKSGVHGHRRMSCSRSPPLHNGGPFVSDASMPYPMVVTSASHASGDGHNAGGTAPPPSRTSHSSAGAKTPSSPHRPSLSRDLKRNSSQYSPIRLTPASSPTLSTPAIARQHVHATTMSLSGDASTSSGQVLHKSGASGSSASDAPRRRSVQALANDGDAQSASSVNAQKRQQRLEGSGESARSAYTSSSHNSQSSGSSGDARSADTSVTSTDSVLGKLSTTKATEDVKHAAGALQALDDDIKSDADELVRPAVGMDLQADGSHSRSTNNKSNDPYSHDLKSQQVTDLNQSKTNVDPASPAAQVATTDPSPAQSTTMPKAEFPSLNEQQQPQAQPQTDSTPIPTIAQRDALASRVYAACQAAGHDEWLYLLDLAPLASQHHLSGYNCIKFGHDGSPFAYLPLTLQQPNQTEELISKQKESEAKALEWLAQKRARLLHDPRSEKQGENFRPFSGQDGTTSEFANGGVNAPASGAQFRSIDVCDVQMDDVRPTPAAKGDPTSDTVDPQNQTGERRSANGNAPVAEGPLQTESVLTQEWEAPINASGTGDRGSDAPSQTIAAQQFVSHAVKTSNTHPISISPIIPPELLAEVSWYVEAGIPSTLQARDRSAVYGHGHACGADSQALAAEHDQLQKQGRRLIRCRVTRLDLCEVAYKAEQELVDATQNRRKPRLLTLNEPGASGNEYCQTVYRGSGIDEDLVATKAHQMYAALNGSSLLSMPLRAKNGEGKDPFVMGNLLLSSCPGKKVRLTGPVRGRGAICRSLDIDLKRIKELGVGAIVCCLDDEELQFLGAPWAEYEQEVDKLGVEVIRLPMAEGFCPTDVIATDEAISCVVDDYTLRGIHVLVHCRGGVGRAGLIACAWMLKLGLVRSDCDEKVFRQMLAGKTDVLLQPSEVTRNHEDVRQTITRLVETIRRRRSPKAIETAEQVLFLSKYVAYLHQQESKCWQHPLASAPTQTA